MRIVYFVAMAVAARLLCALLLVPFSCTRDPFTHADNAIVADDAAHALAPAPDAAFALVDSAPSVVASASADAWVGPRPLTTDEVADRCGYKGSLICCLGPPIGGPPLKPYCYPAQ